MWVSPAWRPMSMWTLSIISWWSKKPANDSMLVEWMKDAGQVCWAYVTVSMQARIVCAHPTHHCHPNLRHRNLALWSCADVRCLGILPCKDPQPWSMTFVFRGLQTLWFSRHCPCPFSPSRWPLKLTKSTIWQQLVEQQTLIQMRDVCTSSRFRR